VSRERPGTRPPTGQWMLYGASGHTGSLVARHAGARGHQPVLAGRSVDALGATAASLGMPYRVVALDDRDGLQLALRDVDLVLNAAGPFLHTAPALAEACLSAGVHYLDISNELQVFRALYALDTRAGEAGAAIIPGVGFGVMATNGIARRVSDAVGGARELLVAARIAAGDPGPGAAVTMRENMPFGGWVREDGALVARELFSGAVTIAFPDGSARAVPVPTGDLEAAFRATGAPDVVAYAAESREPAADEDASAAMRSFAWASAVAADGTRAEALLETGDSYAFTAAAAVLAVEQTMERSPRGALSPADAFGSDLVLGIAGTTRVDIDTPLMHEARPAAG
jgi:short subunit dehydrogenase-like uncharacterized protein